MSTSARKVFINAGWPYGYAEPGLHNFLPLFLADVLARFYRSQGAETFFIGGMDEHGQKVATYARIQGTTPQALVDDVYTRTVRLLQDFHVSVDTWGRTSSDHHHAYVTDYIDGMRRRSNKVVTTELDSAYCAKCATHVPDRFLEASCPQCDSASYGGRCSNLKCGLVHAHPVEETRCGVCTGPITSRPAPQLVLRALGRDRAWNPDEVSVLTPRGPYTPTADGADSVGLSRPGDWGVEITGMPGHVVYSWIDSLLAKLSHAPDGLSPLDPDVGKIFVLGPDSIPFYADLFPELLAEAGHPVTDWSVLSTPLALFQGNVCSKTTANGIWLREALQVLPGSAWRLYLSHLLGRAQGDSTVEFDWDEFADLLLAWSQSSVNDSGTSVGTFDEGEFAARMRDGKLGSAFQYAIGRAQAGDERAQRAVELFVPQTDDLAEFLREGDARQTISQARYRYEELVEQRLTNRSVGQAIFDVRATFMCACSANLGEQ